jgi:hypothetical protein
MRSSLHRVFAATAAGGAAVAAIAISLAGGPSEDASRPHFFASGLQAPLSHSELQRAADLVVRGIPLADVGQPFPNNERIPERYTHSLFFLTGEYHDVRFAVTEYMKGEGSPVLSIRRRVIPADAPPGEGAPAPRLGEEEVLYLIHGAGVWSGGELVLGPQGMGRATSEGKLRFDSGRIARVSTLRRIATRQRRHREGR